MTLTIVLALATAALVVYIRAGFDLVARSHIARTVQRHCEDFPGLAANPRNVAQWRRDAIVDTLFMMPIWPAVLAFRALTARIDAAAPLSPYEMQQQIDERDERIASLERELGVGRQGTR